MIRINLLPHREQKRQARQRQFVSLSIGLAVLGVAVVVARARGLRRADREPAEPQHAAQDRDRQARRADQGDRQAARADAGAARAQAGRRDAADRTGPKRCTCSTRWCASCRTASTCRSMKQIGAEGHADRLRAVERARLDADAQHRVLAVAAAARAGRDQVGSVADRQGPARERIHAQRAGEASGAARRAEGCAAAGAAAGASRAAPPRRPRRRSEI